MRAMCSQSLSFSLLRVGCAQHTCVEYCNLKVESSSNANITEKVCIFLRQRGVTVGGTNNGYVIMFFICLCD